jgi:hypothetical protein
MNPDFAGSLRSDDGGAAGSVDFGMTYTRVS